jgi:V/A-type H+-transporting ATPase subunit A
VTLRTARLLREAVLQQSAVLDNDQYSSPAKQRALLELVLEVHDRLSALLDRGAEIAEVDSFDLEPALRARYDTPPDGAADVERIGRDLLASLEGLLK